MRLRFFFLPKNIQTKKFNFYFKYTRVENKRTSLAIFSNTFLKFTSLVREW